MTQSAIPDNRPHRPADDTEEVYFEGSPLLRAELGKVLSWGISGVTIIVVMFISLLKWKNGWPWWVYVGWFAGSALITFMPLMLRKTLRYRITNYRIDVSSGVLSRNTDTVELWHVEDLRLHQSLLNRLANVGTITVTSHDQALPTLALYGLPKPNDLFRLLEQRVIAVKRQRGVMKVDPG